MKSISCKYVFKLFETERDCKSPLKFRRGSLKGFTLIEILVAMTIIVMIVSMVYGSYFVTAKSTDVYKTRMTLSGRMRKVLSQMSRQIRCSYIGEANEDKDSAEKDFGNTNTIRKSPVIYFNYELDARGSWTLHLVTTNRLFCDNGYANGLIDAAYKFDKNIGTFYLSQKRFIGTSENNIEDRNWRPLLENVESVELEFFDGRQWLREWDFEQNRKIPISIKIGMTCENENSRQRRYSTVAYVDCSRNLNPTTLALTLVSK